MSSATHAVILNAELAHEIFSRAMLSSLIAVRTLNREMESLSHLAFVKKAFSTVYISWTEPGIQRFLAMTSRPEIAKVIRKVVIRYHFAVFRRRENVGWSAEQLRFALASNLAKSSTAKQVKVTVQKWVAYHSLEAEQRRLECEMFRSLLKAFSYLHTKPIELFFDVLFYNPGTDTWLDSSKQEGSENLSLDEDELFPVSKEMARFQRACKPHFVCDTWFGLGFNSTLMNPETAADVVINTLAGDHMVGVVRFNAVCLSPFWFDPRDWRAYLKGHDGKFLVVNLYDSIKPQQKILTDWWIEE